MHGAYEDAGFAQKVGVSLKTLQNWDRLGILVARRTVVVFSLGLVHVPVIMQPLTVPLGVSGFFATGGDVRGSLLQFFNLAVSALIYYPFFKAWERILIAREEAAVQPEEIQVRTPAQAR